jgi:hypothetical protein
MAHPEAIHGAMPGTTPRAHNRVPALAGRAAGARRGCPPPMWVAPAPWPPWASASSWRHAPSRSAEL